MTVKKNDPIKIGTVLEEVLSEKGYFNTCKEYGVMQKWPTLIDSKFAAVTKCEKIENGILFVRVLSAAWRHEALYHKETILSRIHGKLGCPTIKDIVFY